jgi:hypothetical protein
LAFPALLSRLSFSVPPGFWFMRLAGDLIPSETIADDLRFGQLEAFEIVHLFATIVN